MAVVSGLTLRVLKVARVCHGSEDVVLRLDGALRLLSGSVIEITDTVQDVVFVQRFLDSLQSVIYLRMGRASTLVCSEPLGNLIHIVGTVDSASLIIVSLWRRT